MATTNEPLSKHGAGILCATIEAYWAARRPRVVVMRHEVPGFPDNWQVRSNLVNGLPPGGTAKSAGLVPA